jgi:predicted anti-sigma-YlaC factor YlaD
MKPDIHEWTQELMATGEIETLTGVARRQVQEHLSECAACREFGELIGGLERALHSISIAADASLVNVTRARVHYRAAELERQRQRWWLITLSTALVALSTVVTTPFLLQGFAWLGSSMHVPNLVWQAGFVLFWISPALLASVLLSAFGVHWSERRGSETHSG